MSQQFCALIFLTACSPADGQAVENTFLIVFYDANATTGGFTSDANGPEEQAGNLNGSDNSGGRSIRYSAAVVPGFSTIVLLGIVTLAMLAYCVYDSSCPLGGRRSSPREGGTV